MATDWDLSLSPQSIDLGDVISVWCRVITNARSAKENRFDLTPRHQSTYSQPKQIGRIKKEEEERNPANLQSIRLLCKEEKKKKENFLLT